VLSQCKEVQTTLSYSLHGLGRRAALLQRAKQHGLLVETPVTLILKVCLIQGSLSPGLACRRICCAPVQGLLVILITKTRPALMMVAGIHRALKE
jgi:hypothetical protein